MSLAFLFQLFNAQDVSDVNTSILRSLRLICWVISWVVLLWYDACWLLGVYQFAVNKIIIIIIIIIIIWLGWYGILMQAVALLQPA